MTHLKCIVLTIVAATLLLPARADAHETKEVAGLTIVFGAEPEPALTGDRQHLVWRFRDKESKEPFGDLEELKAIVKRDAKSYGPFDARLSRRDVGTAQTTHIFTAPGEYEATLTFRKKGSPETHTVVFTFRIGDRRDLEIPR